MHIHTYSDFTSELTAILTMDSECGCPGWKMDTMETHLGTFFVRFVYLPDLLKFEL